MQISRRVLLACATATILLPLVSFAGDTEAQIKERQALEQKMKELQGQTSIPAQPAKPAAKPPAQASAPPQAPKHTLAAATFAPVAGATPANDAQNEALQNALNKKMKQIEGQTPAGKTPAAAAAAAAAAATTSKESSEPASEAQSDDLHDALNKKMNELNEQPPTAQAAAAAGHTYQNVPLAASSTAEALALQKALEQGTQEAHQAAIEAAVLEAQANQQMAAAHPPELIRRPKSHQTHPSNLQASLPPLPAPPPAVSAGKEQQLHALLQQYMSDQISPEQYHERRAKILAGP